MSGPVQYHAGAFPPEQLRWDELIPQLGPAAAAVARYDGMLAAVPNPDVLLSPLTTQEAVLSSRIEGTHATMGEVLQFEADPAPRDLTEARREDIEEILNYRTAMRLAQELLDGLPLSVRLVRQIHEVLLRGVRGQSRAPGELRRVPNWIGPAGCTVETARFVPIAAAELPEAMGAWERYIHADRPDRLVQLAILHAEFEALHPFLDGNGRMGRILVPLFLWRHELIRQPTFYVSAYLEAHREEYFERLLAISRDGDWTGWCAFFLTALRVQAEDNLRKAQAILALYDELKPRVMEWTRSQYAIHALDWIFGRPIFKSTDFVKASPIPDPSARRLLTKIREEGLVREVNPASGRRAAILVFPRLINIAEGRDIV